MLYSAKMKDTIAKAVYDMETGKSDGFDGLSSDYF